MDAAWWQVYGEDVQRSFAGLKFTQAGGVKGVKRVSSPRTFNSGAGAIMLAKELCASSVALLGYDGAKVGGRAHWHEDHPKGLGNAGAVDLWAEQFRELAPMIRMPVVNCSRHTAIDAFKRSSLEDYLNDHSRHDGVGRQPVSASVPEAIYEHGVLENTLDRALP